MCFRRIRVGTALSHWFTGACFCQCCCFYAFRTIKWVPITESDGLAFSSGILAAAPGATVWGCQFQAFPSGKLPSFPTTSFSPLPTLLPFLQRPPSLSSCPFSSPLLTSPPLAGEDLSRSLPLHNSPCFVFNRCRDASLKSLTSHPRPCLFSSCRRGRYCSHRFTGSLGAGRGWRHARSRPAEPGILAFIASCLSRE